MQLLACPVATPLGPSVEKTSCCQFSVYKSLFYNVVKTSVKPFEKLLVSATLRTYELDLN